MQQLEKLVLRQDNYERLKEHSKDLVLRQQELKNVLVKLKEDYNREKVLRLQELRRD